MNINKLAPFKDNKILHINNMAISHVTLCQMASGQAPQVGRQGPWSSLFFRFR